MAQIVAWENSRAFGDATTGFSDTLHMRKVISTEKVRNGWLCHADELYK